MAFFDRFRRKPPENVPEDAPANGYDAVDAPVNKNRLREFDTELLKYQSGKQFHDERVRRNYEYYKLRQWDVIKGENKGKVQQQIEPKSAWLFNAIANKHADAMDNFPRPNILPREENDREQAERLTDILPVILDQCEFEKTYSDVNWDKAVIGTGVYGVFWNKEKMNGLGDVDIQRIDILNLFWQPGIRDIQDSRYVFHTAMIDNDILESTFPELKGKLGGNALFTRRRRHEDNIDTTNMSLVVDAYYKLNQNGRTVLHYCKYCGDTILYATENDRQADDKGRVPAVNGLYDHGMFPFVFDVLFPNSDSPAGFGYIDIGADTQNYIDRMSQSILKNTMASAAPRYFSKKDSGINKEQFADLTQEIVEYAGTIDSITPIMSKGLDSAALQTYHDKIDELKEVTGNRDVSTGGTTSGVTAASAIAAMQEAGSKMSRDSSKASYRQYRQIILLCIELIRQRYDIARAFRITGKDGEYDFITYSNEKIVPQPQSEVDANGVPSAFGVDVGYRLPLFDIEITAEKQSPYSRMSQNELMLQFYQLRMFDPEMSDQALACIEGMDFDRKESIIQRISMNGTLLQMLVQAQQRELMMAQIIDQMKGTNLAQQVAQELIPTQGAPEMGNPEEVDLSGGTGESTLTQNARRRTAEMTNPT